MRNPMAYAISFVPYLEDLPEALHPAAQDWADAVDALEQAEEDAARTSLAADAAPAQDNAAAETAARRGNPIPARTAPAAREAADAAAHALEAHRAAVKAPAQALVAALAAHRSALAALVAQRIITAHAAYEEAFLAAEAAALELADASGWLDTLSDLDEGTRPIAFGGWSISANRDPEARRLHDAATALKTPKPKTKVTVIDSDGHRLELPRDHAHYFVTTQGCHYENPNDAPTAEPDAA